MTKDVLRLRRGLLTALSRRVGDTSAMVIPAFREAIEELQRYAETKGDFKPINFLSKRAVRALFGWMEVSTSFMVDTIVLHGKTLNASIPEKDLAVLSKLSRSGAGGKKSSQRLHRGLDERMKLALRHFPKLFGSEFEPDFRDRAGRWQQVTDLCSIRNGFSHPTRFIDLLGQRAMPLILPSTAWFADQILAIIATSGERAGVVPSLIPVSEIAGTLPKFDRMMKSAPEKVFDESFDREVAECGLSAIRLLRQWGAIHDYEQARALEDLSEAMAGKSGDMNDLYRRDFVLALSASAESTIGFVDWYLGAAEKRGELLRTARGGRGSGVKASLSEQLVSLLNEFASSVGKGSSRELNSSGFRSFERLIEVRDRLIHPEHDRDLGLCDDDLRNAVEAFGWYTEIQALLEIDVKKFQNPDSCSAEGGD